MTVLDWIIGSRGSLRKFSAATRCLVCRAKQKLSGTTGRIPSMAKAPMRSCIDIWHGRSQQGCERQLYITKELATLRWIGNVQGSQIDALVRNSAVVKYVYTSPRM